MKHRLKWWWLRLRRKTFWVVAVRGSQQGARRRCIYEKSTPRMRAYMLLEHPLAPGVKLEDLEAV